MKEINSIVVIDDDADDYNIFLEAVREAGFDNIELNFIPRHEGRDCDFDRYDLVMLDINMPHFDGFEWLDEIRKVCGHHVPIIMYTNSNYPGHVRKAFEHGAHLYFTKPDSFRHLVSAIKKILQMDWSQPEKIREAYYAPGRMKIFEQESY